MSKLISKFNTLAKNEMSKVFWDENREPGYRYFHCLRTADLANNIVKNSNELKHLESEIDIIIAASLVHDIRKMEEDHAEEGAKYIKSFLADKKYISDEDKTKIVKIIKHHNTRNNDDLPDYVKVVQDADILSRYGSIMIYSECYNSGLQKSTRNKVLKNKKECDLKFQKDISKLNFQYSREFITKEYQIMSEFYKNLEKEFIIKLDI